MKFNKERDIPDGIPDYHMGKLIHVSHGSSEPRVIKFDTGLVPMGSDAAWVKLVKAGNADVQIIAGDGMTLRAPGGGSSYTISQLNKVVEVTVTAADAPGDTANTIYISDPDYPRFSSPDMLEESVG